MEPASGHISKHLADRFQAVRARIRAQADVAVHGRHGHGQRQRLHSYLETMKSRARCSRFNCTVKPWFISEGLVAGQDSRLVTTLWTMGMRGRMGLGLIFGLAVGMASCGQLAYAQVAALSTEYSPDLNLEQMDVAEIALAHKTLDLACLQPD